MVFERLSSIFEVLAPKKKYSHGRMSHRLSGTGGRLIYVDARIQYSFYDTFYKTVERISKDFSLCFDPV